MIKFLMIIPITLASQNSQRTLIRRIQCLNYIDVSKSINALIGKNTLERTYSDWLESNVHFSRKPGHPGYEQDDSDDE